MSLSELEEVFKKKLRRYFPNMDSYALLVESNIARLQFMNYTISVGLSEPHDPKMLLFAKAAEMVDLLYSASRKRFFAEDQKRQLEFRKSCARQQINRSQSASVEDKVSFMREEKESFKKLKTRCSDSGDIASSHIRSQEANFSVSNGHSYISSYETSANQDLCTLSEETDGFTVRSVSSEYMLSELPANSCADNIDAHISQSSAMHDDLPGIYKVTKKSELCFDEPNAGEHKAKSSSDASLQPSKDALEEGSHETLSMISNGPAESQKSEAVGKNSLQEKFNSPSQKNIPDTSYMKQVMAESKDQSHGFISVVRSFCTHYRILPPEFEIVRENDVFRCTAIFLGINFVSSYEYDKLDSKNDSCKKVVEYIVRNWKSIFQHEQYCFR